MVMYMLKKVMPIGKLGSTISSLPRQPIEKKLHKRSTNKFELLLRAELKNKKMK